MQNIQKCNWGTAASGSADTDLAEMKNTKKTYK